MTTVDAFQHLCRELDRHQADGLPEVRDLVRALYALRDDVSAHQPTPPDTSVSAIATRMRALTPITPTPLLIDTALDCETQIPQTVIAEVQAAVSALYRTTPQPYGYQHWRDYHRRFRARYGVGALVPVLDLVSDSGLGLPAGYIGSERSTALKLRTDRDELLLALVQQVLLDGRDELRLTDDMVDALEKAAGSGERLFVPHVEAAFEVHSPSTTALSRGSFVILLTAAPRPGSSMAGRFAHVLPPEHRDALGATYEGAPGGLTAQLVFPPRRHRNENVTRTPQLLPHVIELSGHQEADESTIRLADIAVTADPRSFHLLQISTGQPIDVRVLHALEGGTQTPPLARFLAEVANGRFAAYKPFDFGAGSRLPFLPRVVYRRTILAGVRARTGSLPAADRALRRWGGHGRRAPGVRGGLRRRPRADPARRAPKRSPRRPTPPKRRPGPRRSADSRRQCRHLDTFTPDRHHRPRHPPALRRRGSVLRNRHGSLLDVSTTARTTAQSRTVPEQLRVAPLSKNPVRPDGIPEPVVLVGAPP